MSEVTFADGNAFVSADADGTELKKQFSFTFDPTKFPHAGVFRFQITETVGERAREKVAVENGSSYADTRYLDVYVRNKLDNTTTPATHTYEIYGYVLFEATSANTSIDKETTKSNGYVNTASSGNPKDVDVYTTFNAYVQKHVTGSMADITHAFPFDISLANTGTYTEGEEQKNLGRNTKIRVAATDTKATVGDGVTSWTGSSTAQETNTYIALNGGSDVNLKKDKQNTIKHEGEIGLFGIPADTTIMVEETNDTYDVYTASATVADGSDSATAKNIDFKAASTATNYTQDVSSAALNSTGLAKLHAVESITAKKVVDFTNTLIEISPTGYVSRFAPYALILVGGIVLLVIAKKRKPTKDEEE